MPNNALIKKVLNNSFGKISSFGILLGFFLVMPSTLLGQASFLDSTLVNLENEKVHSPHKATFYSALIPGLGQAYNKKYWKIPIIYGSIAGLAYGLNFNTNQYNRYKNAYRDFIIRDPQNKSYESIAINSGLSLEEVEGAQAEWFKNALNNKQQYYKRSRDLTYIGFVAVYVLSLVDASVDAHFFTYDISNDISLRYFPEVQGSYLGSTGTIGLNLKLNF